MDGSQERSKSNSSWHYGDAPHVRRVLDSVGAWHEYQTLAVSCNDNYNTIHLRSHRVITLQPSLPPTIPSIPFLLLTNFVTYPVE